MSDRKEYIERGALLDALTSEEAAKGLQHSAVRAVCLKNVFDRIPAADVVEVVHAQLDDNGRCTNCGKQANVQSVGFGHCVGSHRINYEHTKFCSECGAKMDGVTDNNVGGKTDGKEHRK